MDIGAKNSYPSCSLSNFSPHPFEIDGVLCNSMEGFLQSLKFKNPEMQKKVCLLVGIHAKSKGERKKWWKTQTLYWQNNEYSRESQEYSDLITRAYDNLFLNQKFRNALKATNSATLTHSLGKRKKNETILTKIEFIEQLNRLRNKL